MNYMLSGTTVVAYDYRAQTYCAQDMREIAMGKLSEIGSPSSPWAETASTEDVLDVWASRSDIDRTDEYSFDQGEFPKVVFASQVEGVTRCGDCGQNVLDRR
jgi:hypothetical protein